jgi:hypothetical protein
LLDGQSGAQSEDYLPSAKARKYAYIGSSPALFMIALAS